MAKKKAAAKKAAPKKAKSNKPKATKGEKATYETKPAILRIKNTVTGEWNYWTGAGYSVAKKDAKVFEDDYSCAKEVARLNLKTAVIINA